MKNQEYDAVGSSKNRPLIKELPLFELEVTDEHSTVMFHPTSYFDWDKPHQTPMLLSEFVVALLIRKIRFCTQIRAKTRQEVKLIFAEIVCYKCKKPFHVYYNMNILYSDCGEIIYKPQTVWDDNKHFLSPSILAAVREFARSPEGSHIRVGHIKKRYSHTMGYRYLSFGCFYCDAICGDRYAFEAIGKAESEPKSHTILEKVIFNTNRPSNGNSYHWCLPKNGDFCCDK